MISVGSAAAEEIFETKIIRAILALVVYREPRAITASVFLTLEQKIRSNQLDLIYAYDRFNGSVTSSAPLQSASAPQFLGVHDSVLFVDFFVIVLGNSSYSTTSTIWTLCTSLSFLVHAVKPQYRSGGRSGGVFS